VHGWAIGSGGFLRARRDALGRELGGRALGLVFLDTCSLVAGLAVRPARWGWLVELALLLALGVLLRLRLPGADPQLAACGKNGQHVEPAYHRAVPGELIMRGHAPEAVFIEQMGRAQRLG